ncbi:hypothetical protein EI171_37055 [Bradyrhizobium sp. LCT2]|nr:hypothetical protein EI171_37055 [Bradyrhizobium sp. LCT2]
MRIAPRSSLRAQRSNPESLRENRLDCFSALAMTEQGARPLLFNWHFTQRHKFAFSQRFSNALAMPSYLHFASYYPILPPCSPNPPPSWNARWAAPWRRSANGGAF